MQTSDAGQTSPAQILSARAVTLPHTAPVGRPRKGARATQDPPTDAKAPRRRGRPKQSEEDKSAYKPKSGKRKSANNSSKSRASDNAYRPTQSSKPHSTALTAAPAELRCFESDISGVIDEIRREFADAQQAEAEALREMERRYFDFSAVTEGGAEAAMSSAAVPAAAALYAPRAGSHNADGSFDYKC